MNTIIFQIKAFFKRLLPKKEVQSQPIQSVVNPIALAIEPVELKTDASLINKNHLSDIKDQDIGDLIFWSKNYNGYTRQACVVKLTGVFEAEVFSAILLRLNDYVPQVRKAAEDAFRLWLKKEYLHFFIEYFTEIVALESRSRISAKTLEDIANYLEYGKADFQKIMRCEQGKRSKAIFDWSIKYQWFDLEELNQISKNSVNPLIRRYWIEFLRTSNQTNDLIDNINSRYKDVQYAAFQLLVNERDVAVWQDIGIKLLTSKNIGLRNLVIFYLKHNDFDFQNFLSTQLQKIQNEIEILRYLAIAEYLKLFTLAPIAIELLQTKNLKLNFGALQYLMAIENDTYTEQFLLNLGNHQQKMMYVSQIIKTVKQWGRQNLTLEKAILIIRKLNLGFEANYKIAQLLYFWDRLALSLYLISISSPIEVLNASIREKMTFILIQELGKPQISLSSLNQKNFFLLKDALRTMIIEDKEFDLLIVGREQLIRLNVLESSDIPLSLKGAKFL